jgi:hypothetical protein
LADAWRVDISGQTCLVYAPRLRASLPPAIHTDQMEKNTEQNWLRFDGEQQMAELEKSMTPTLEVYAADERHLNLVREQCRKIVPFDYCFL